MKERALTFLMIFLLLFGVGISRAQESDLAIATLHSGIYLVDQGFVDLEIAFDFADGVSMADARDDFPNAIDILTGNFFNRPNRQLATMLIVDGVYYHAPTGIKNRAVIAQEFADLGGQIIITTEQKACEDRHCYRIAMEAGPFLIADSVDFDDWDIKDPSFYRSTHRVGVGLMEDGRFFWLRFYGRLETFREFAKYHLNRGNAKIKHFMCLDGGSSTHQDARLPTRLVILPR